MAIYPPTDALVQLERRARQAGLHVHLTLDRQIVLTRSRWGFDTFRAAEFIGSLSEARLYLASVYHV